MLAQLLRTSPGPISAVALMSGFLMIASGRFPLGIIGAVLIMFAFLVPFLRLGITPEPRAGDRRSVTNAATLTAASSQRDAVLVEEDALDQYLDAFSQARDQRTIADIIRAERALYALRLRHDTPAVTSSVLDQLELELANLKSEIEIAMSRDHQRKAEPLAVDG